MVSRSEQDPGASSSLLINDPHDPFGSSDVALQPRYYDNESDNQDYDRRDTYGFNSSHGLHDGERYYDNDDPDPYSSM